MTGSDQPDWPKIRRLYVSGALTLTAIAEQCGVSTQRIAGHARKEGWPPRRRRTQGAREGPIPKQASAKRETKQRDAGSPATTLKARRALVRRLYKAIDTKLKQMERRMAHDMATAEDNSDTSAADHERDTRAIGALIANLSRVTEIEADLERLPGSSSPAEQQGAQHAERQLADEAERFRGEVAERLARLVRPA
jgi:small-conductance mechanosensitive channel